MIHPAIVRSAYEELNNPSESAAVGDLDEGVESRWETRSILLEAEAAKVLGRTVFLGSTARVGVEEFMRHEVESLRQENSMMRVELNDLRRVVSNLSNLLVEDEPSQPQLRDIDDESAKREIKALFERHDGDTLYPDDIAETLNISVRQAIDLCNELHAEGLIVVE